MSALEVRNRAGEVVAVTLVDEDDAEMLSQHRWHLSTKGYAQTGFYLGGGRAAGRTTTRVLHLVLLNPPGGMVVDHINRDVLDNRRENLRVITAAQNAQNKGGWGKSAYRGVVHKGPRYKSKPWQAQVRHQGQMHYLGMFATEAEAGAAAAAKRAELMPFSTEEVATFPR